VFFFGVCEAGADDEAIKKVAKKMVPFYPYRIKRYMLPAF